MTTETVHARAIPHDTFAARLMLARLHAGRMSIRDAAQLCGFTNESWSGWERGRKPQDLLDVVEAISEGLDVDRDWLLFGGPLTQPEGRARAVKRRLPARGERNTLRYAPMANQRRDSVRPAGRNQDNRGPSSRRPRVIPRPLAASG